MSHPNQLLCTLRDCRRRRPRNTRYRAGASPYPDRTLTGWTRSACPDAPPHSGHSPLTQHFWSDLLTDKERDAIRAFLGKDGYDTKDEDLTANEGQAYLIHTRDPRYFMPEMVGIDPTRETILRGTFVDAIPEPWLRESALAVAPIIPTSTQAVSAEPSSTPGRPLPHVPLPGEGRPELHPAHQ
jgi:hypothetical protein